MNTSVIDKHVVHLKVCVFARFLLLELNESILQRISTRFVSNDLTSFDHAEAAEDNLEIIIGGNGIELANEENVFWWSNISVGEISNDLQNGRSSLGFAFLKHFLNFSFSLSLCVVNVLISCDPSILKSLWCRRWASAWLFESSRVCVGVLQDNRVSDSDILEGPVFVIHN